MIYRTKLISNIRAEAWVGNPSDIEPYGLVTFPAIDKYAVFQETPRGLQRVEWCDQIVFMPCGDRLVLTDRVFRKLFRLQESAQ